MPVYSEYKVYGPYSRKDKRLHVILIKRDQKGSIIDRKTVSYPKFLVEKYLDKYLNNDETVDHIDGNFLNNEMSNLRIIPRIEHSKSHTSKRKESMQKCMICGKEFIGNGTRITCGSKVCRGKCAHVLGYNKGHSFILKGNDFISNRSLVQEIVSVEAAKSGNPLIGNPEQGSMY